MSYVLSVNVTANSNQPYPRVTEGQSFVITIENTDLTAEKNVDFEISGVSAADFSLSGSLLSAPDNPSYIGLLTGSFNLERVLDDDNNPILRDSIEITLSNDVNLEGNERFTLALVNDPTNKIVVDISDTSFSEQSFVEESSILAKKQELRTEYFDNGTFTIDVNVSGSIYNGVNNLPYYVHGTAGPYITPNTGTLNLNNGTGTITFTKEIPTNSNLNDLYFELQFDNKNSVIEFPIFRERAPITYELVVDQPTISSAENNRAATFTLITTGLDQGTTIGYQCFGDLNDVNGITTGSFVLDADGTDSVTITHKDGTTGSEISYDKTGTIILRLDNGQAKARTTLRKSVSDDSVDGMMQIAAVLDNINNNMIQNNTKTQLILQSIVNQLMDIREDLQGGSGVDTLARLAENQGIRTRGPYSDLEQAVIYKNLILEGGLLRKSQATLTDADVKELLEEIASKPDQELKSESMKYLNNILRQFRSSFGSGF